MEEIASSTTVPEWIMRKKAENDLTKARAEAESERLSAASKAIKLGIPDFLKQLLKELEANVNGLTLIDYVATMSAPAGDIRHEQHRRIEIRRKSIIPTSTYTDIYYSESAPYIRCCPLHSKSYRLDFCLSEGIQITLIAEDQTIPMGPERVAAHIIKKMVSFLERS